jgi:hypothetical protein
MMEENKTPQTSTASAKEEAAKGMFYDHIVPLAQESFEHDGKLGAMVFLFLDDGSEDKVAIAPMPAGMFMESDNKKELLSEILKEFTNVIELVAIGMFAEAWVTELNTEDPENAVKREAFFYSFESENLAFMKRDLIIRSEGDKNPILAHGSVEAADGMSGRFAGLLKDMKKVKLN